MQNQKNVSLVIWGGMVMSLFMYLAVTYAIVQPVADATGAPATDGLTLVLSVAAGGSFLLAWVVPGILWRKSAAKAAEFALTEDPAARLAEDYKFFFPGWVVRLALIESVAVYGFVLAQLTQKPQTILYFVAVSLIGFLMNIPSEANVRKALGK